MEAVSSSPHPAEMICQYAFSWSLEIITKFSHAMKVVSRLVMASRCPETCPICASALRNHYIAPASSSGSEISSHADTLSKIRSTSARSETLSIWCADKTKTLFWCGKFRQGEVSRDVCVFRRSLQASNLIGLGIRWCRPMMVPKKEDLSYSNLSGQLQDIQGRSMLQYIDGRVLENVFHCTLVIWCDAHDF